MCLGGLNHPDTSANKEWRCLNGINHPDTSGNTKWTSPRGLNHPDMSKMKKRTCLGGLNHPDMSTYEKWTCLDGVDHPDTFENDTTGRGKTPSPRVSVEFGYPLGVWKIKQSTRRGFSPLVVSDIKYLTRREGDTLPTHGKSAIDAPRRVSPSRRFCTCRVS